MGFNPPHEDEDPMLAGFGLLVNAMFDGGEDRGASFPASDAADMSQGARFIPGEVTLDRRAGKKVEFVRECSSRCCWYWLREDGSRIYHFDSLTYDQIGRENHGEAWSAEGNTLLAGPCPNCGNPHTNGGSYTSEQVSA